MTDYRDTIGKGSERQTSGIEDAFKNTLGDAKETVTDTASDAKETVTDTGSEAESSITGFVGDVTEGGGLAGFAGEGVSKITDAQEDLASGVTNFVAGEGTAEDIESGVDNLFSSGEDFVGDQFESVDETLSGATEGLNDFQEDITSFGGNITNNATDFVSEQAEGAADLLGSGFGGATDVVSGIGETATDALGSGFDTVTDIPSGVIGEATDFGSSLQDLGTDFVSDSANRLLSVGEGLTDFSQGVVDFGTDIAGGGIDAIAGIGAGTAEVVTGQGSQNKQWSDPSQVEQLGRCVIMKQTASDGSERFMTVTANSQDQEVALSSSGEMVVIQSVESMDQVPFHSTLQEARDACSAAGLERNWGELQQYETHKGGVIMEQPSETGDSRYFALSSKRGSNVAIASDGSSVPISDDTNPSSLPNYPDPDSARAALNESDLVTRQWGEMSEVGQIDNCIIMKQQSSDGNERFFTFTEQDGETVAVGNDGTGVAVSSVDNVQRLPHYPTREDAEAACPSTESQPSEGGDTGLTDDSSSSDGPVSGEGGLGADPGGIMSAEIAGIPIPLIGGAGLLGAGAIALLGSDSEGARSMRTPNSNTGSRNGGNSQGTRTESRTNVSRRGRNGNGNNGGS